MHFIYPARLFENLSLSDNLANYTIAPNPSRSAASGLVVVNVCEEFYGNKRNGNGTMSFVLPHPLG